MQKCDLCSQQYTTQTINRYGGSCYHCFNKKKMEYGACSICKNQFNITVLNRRAGMCQLCFNSVRVNCLACDADFSRLTISKYNGICGRCHNYLKQSLDEVRRLPPRLSSTKSQKIKSFKIEVLKQPMCAICLNMWDNDDDIIMLDCHHYYHSDCVNSWFALGHDNCPTCNL